MIKTRAVLEGGPGAWGIGLAVELWPQTARSYAPEANPWALGMTWMVQLAGLAWLWSGRSLLESPLLCDA